MAPMARCSEFGRRGAIEFTSSSRTAARQADPFHSRPKLKEYFRPLLKEFSQERDTDFGSMRKSE
jgi:hypothetical protein